MKSQKRKPEHRHHKRNKAFSDTSQKPIQKSISQKQTFQPKEYEGNFMIGRNGIGYVVIKETDQIIEIPHHQKNTALHRDIVRVSPIHWKTETGTVAGIIKRAKKAHVGILEKTATGYQLAPASFRDQAIILRYAQNQDVGKRVAVTITSWDGEIPYGEITKVFDGTDTNSIEMQSIAIEKGFDEAFPESVLQEAHAIQLRGIQPADLINRKDMRLVQTCTIDPADAKDFDDALSFRITDDGYYEIGIHIADVSHYVIPNSFLDKEARERTTSVYLVDRTIPMLPEALSNDLCSLKPNEDRLAMSAIFIIDPKDGSIRNEWFGKTVIHSDKRFTYEEAQELLEQSENDHPFWKPLHILNTLAKQMTHARMAGGALDLEQEEVKFVLDEQGVPLRVVLKERKDAHRLIEEFMLLANKRVAEFMAKKAQNKIFVYRIHDLPDPEKMESLGKFFKLLGYKVTFKKGIIPPEVLRDIVHSTDTKEARDTLSSAIIRSMAKAIYSTDNIGHYGLGFTYYTHFTSPIRRYPDVLAHRILQSELEHVMIPAEEYHDIKYLCMHSSNRERDAQEAERNSVKYKQVEYMSSRIGTVFQGIITGMNKYGLFVAEKETKSEGMVRMSDIPNDYFVFDEKKHAIIGSKTKQKYMIGNQVTIIIKDASKEKQTIDYAIINPQE